MDLRMQIADAIDSFIDVYCALEQHERIWRRPLVRFADVRHPAFARLGELTGTEHFQPEDFLEDPRVVISYFLPFVPTIAEGNVSGRPASAGWADAYLTTNAMAVAINRRLADLARDLGGRAGIPENIGLLPDTLMSRWSQRHVAWIAGHGAFGLNNMLITGEGCCGRYFSVVADIPVEPDAPVEEEYCLHRSKGVCGVCVKRCFSGALSVDGFDRFKCYDECLKNEVLHSGADVCGKCVVGLPCSFRRP